MTKFVYIEHEGKKGTISFWARHFGIEVSVFKMRYYRYGWNLDKLTTPPQKRSKSTREGNMLLKPVPCLATTEITHDGITKTIEEWSAYLGIPYDTLRMRYARGLRGDELFKQVRRYRK